MVTNLLPPMLLVTFAKHLEMNRIVVFSSNIVDKELHYLKDISKLEGVSCHTLEERPGGDFDELKLEDFVKTMIVDSASFHTYVGDNENWFKSDIAWVVADNGSQTGESLPRLRFDSQFYTVSGEEEEPYTLKEVYRAKSRLFENPIGTWDSSNGLNVSDPYIWNRRKNLMGVTITAASLTWAVFSKQVNDTFFTGYVPEMLESIASDCNFSVSWIVPKDGNYGAPLKNGSFNGLAGLLERKDVDIVAAGFAVTLERSAVVSYSNSLFESPGSLIILDPAYSGTVTEVDSDSYLFVYTPSGWMVVVVLLFSLSLSYIIFFLNSSNNVGCRTCLQGMGKSIWFVFNSGLQLSVPYEFADHPVSSKIFFMIAGSYSIVFIAYYEGVLTSYLTVAPDPPKFNSIGDVVDHGYKVATIAESKHDTDFKLARPGTGRHKAYHKTMKGNPKAYFKDFDTLIPVLLNDPNLAFAGPVHSFIGDSRFLPLAGLSDATSDTVAFGLQKSSDFLGLINYELVKIRSSGLQYFLWNKWSEFRNPEDTCGCKVQDQALALGIQNLFFPIIILVSGIILGICLMIMESLLKLLWLKPMKH